MTTMEGLGARGAPPRVRVASDSAGSAAARNGLQVPAGSENSVFCACCRRDATPMELVRSVLAVSGHVHCGLCVGCGAACPCTTLPQLRAGVDRTVWKSMQSAADTPSPSGTPSPLRRSTGSSSLGSAFLEGGGRSAEAAIQTWVYGRHDDAVVSMERDYSVAACFRIMPCSAVFVLCAAAVQAGIALFALCSISSEALATTRSFEYLTVVFDVAILAFHLALAGALWAFKRRRLHLPSVLQEVLAASQPPASKLLDADRDEADVAAEAATHSHSATGRAEASAAGRERAARVRPTFAQFAGALAPAFTAHMSQLERHMLLGWVQLRMLDPKAAEKFRSVTRCSTGAVLTLGIVAVVVTVSAVLTGQGGGSLLGLPTDGSGTELLSGEAVVVLNTVYGLAGLPSFMGIFTSMYILMTYARLYRHLAAATMNAFSSGVRHLVVARQLTIARLANRMALAAAPEVAWRGEGGNQLAGASPAASPSAARAAEEAAPLEDREALPRWMLAVEDFHGRLTRETRRLAIVLSDLSISIITIAAFGVLLLVADIAGTSAAPESSADTGTALVFSFLPIFMMLTQLVSGARVTHQFKAFALTAANAPLAVPAAVVLAIWKEHAETALEDPSAILARAAQARWGAMLSRAPRTARTSLRSAGTASTMARLPSRGTEEGDKAHLAPTQAYGGGGASPVPAADHPAASGSTGVGQPGRLHVSASGALDTLALSALPEEGLDEEEAALDAVADTGWDPTLIAWHLEMARKASAEGHGQGHYVAPETDLVQLRAHIVSTMEARRPGWYVFGLLITTSVVMSVLSGLAALGSVILQQTLSSLV